MPKRAGSQCFPGRFRPQMSHISQILVERATTFPCFSLPLYTVIWFPFSASPTYLLYQHQHWMSPTPSSSRKQRSRRSSSNSAVSLRALGVSERVREDETVHILGRTHSGLLPVWVCAYYASNEMLICHIGSKGSRGATRRGTHYQWSPSLGGYPGDERYRRGRARSNWKSTVTKYEDKGGYTSAFGKIL